MSEPTTPCDIFMDEDQAAFNFMQSDSKLEEAFRKFHSLNPHVYQSLVNLALQLRRKGREMYGIKSLFEVVRWHRAMETDSEDEFKLNNNHAPYYARMIMKNVPELEQFFCVRVLKKERSRA